MWTLLSFTGRFDPEYFNLHVQGAAVPVALPGEISQEQKKEKRRSCTGPRQGPPGTEIRPPPDKASGGSHAQVVRG